MEEVIVMKQDLNHLKKDEGFEHTVEKKHDTSFCTGNNKNHHEEST